MVAQSVASKISLKNKFMKKHLFNIFCLLMLSNLLFAQAPDKMSYQAIVRNSNNVVVSNHTVGMRISILQGNATGTSVYTETQTPTTNANGLIAIEIGTGTVVSGSFPNIDWANGPYFVKTETDPNGVSNYTLTGTSQLLSVPYALHSKTSLKTDTAKVSQYALNALNGVPSGSQHGQMLTNCDGNLTWTFNGQCPAKFTAFNCADTVHTGTLYNTIVASGTSSTISYSGGNGGVYAAQTIASTGVTGLTATLAAGTLNSGNGTLSLTITGTPTSTGIASFTLVMGNKTCTLQRTVLATPPTPTWATGTVFCNGTPTAVVNVTNPTTGKTWMDRNLGASQAAISSTDASAYGDLYQWGRKADGHQCRNSGTTSTLSTTDQPNHANFILAPTSPYDWRSPQNTNLWQGVNGTNNPCPSGYRIPTNSELDAERTSWSQNNSTGAFNSPLKLPVAGCRYYNDGSLNIVGSYGNYWSSSVIGTRAWYLEFLSGNAGMYNFLRAFGFSVRCIKD
jgi:uncharacterized protein (TIGR02145 family)